MSNVSTEIEDCPIWSWLAVQWYSPAPWIVCCSINIVTNSVLTPLLLLQQQTNKSQSAFKSTTTTCLLIPLFPSWLSRSPPRLLLPPFCVANKRSRFHCGTPFHPNWNLPSADSGVGFVTRQNKEEQQQQNRSPSRCEESILINYRNNIWCQFDNCPLPHPHPPPPPLPATKRR